MPADRVGSLAVALFVLFVMQSENLYVQSSTTNPYRASFGWATLPDGRQMGTVSGCFQILMVGISGSWTAAARTSVPGPI